MAVLGKLIGAMKTGASGAISVSSGMANIAGKIASTAGKVGNFITGGPREQTYGYTAQYFPTKDKKSKLSKTKRVTQIRQSVTPLPGAGSMGMGYNSGDEKLSQMFEFMKRTHEQNMTKIEVQNSFAKERANEDANRHRELLGAIRRFTNVKTTATAITEKKEGGGLLDIFKNMLAAAVSGVLTVVNGLIDGVQKSLEWLSDLKTLMSALGGSSAKILLNLGRFLVSPFGIAILGALTIGAFLKLIADQKAAIEANPNAPEFRDNPYAMKLRGETKSIAQAGQANINRTIKSINRPEIERSVKDNTPDDILVDLYGRDKLNLQKWLSDNPTEMKYQAPVAPIVGLPRTSAVAGEVARTMATPLPADVSSSTAGAGRGSAEAAATDSRRSDIPTATPTPPTPVSAPVSGAINENMVLSQNVDTSPYTPPLVSVNGSTQTEKAPPMSSSATWRDDEPMVDRVLQRTRSYV